MQSSVSTQVGFLSDVFQRTKPTGGNHVLILIFLGLGICVGGMWCRRLLGVLCRTHPVLSRVYSHGHHLVVCERARLLQ